MHALFKSVFNVLVVVALGYFAYGGVMYRTYSQAFIKTRDGETLEVVLQRFGNPSHIETHHNGYGYDSGSKSVCTESCWLRLWYEMPFTLGASPVTVDFDAQQKVIHKYEWNSP